MFRFATRLAALLLLVALTSIFGACLAEFRCAEDSAPCAQQSADGCFCHAALLIPAGVEPVTRLLESFAVSYNQHLVLPVLGVSIFQPPKA